MASRTCENWWVPGARTGPIACGASGSVPVPDGVGCFRPSGTQHFIFGPDWGVFLRATKGGKDSLRNEPPHTRNPGLVRAMWGSGDPRKGETSKQPRD